MARFELWKHGELKMRTSRLSVLASWVARGGQYVDTMLEVR